MLLHSYYDFNFVLKQPISIISRLLVKAVEKRDKKELWEIWLAKYPHMTKDNFIDFETFWKRRNQPIQQPEYVGESVEDTFNRFKKIAQGEGENEGY